MVPKTIFMGIMEHSCPRERHVTCWLIVYLLHILTLEGEVLVVCLKLTPASLFSPLEVMNSSPPPTSRHHLEIPTAVICCLQHTLSTDDKCQNRDHWKEIWHLALSHSLPTDDSESSLVGESAAVPGVPAGASGLLGLAAPVHAPHQLAGFEWHFYSGKPVCQIQA